jgi:glycosyltransferase involved in cell wall biosynthesis
MSLVNPLVSIITPCFNRENFLPETIDSVLGQDYPNIEHLALDDGSTDGTPGLLEEYQRRNPGRFRWMRHDNIGQSRTLNKGFSLARGHLLMILNSDDTLLDGAISHLVDALVEDDGVIAAFPDFRVVDEKGAMIVELLAKSYSFAEMVRTQNNFLGPGVLFTKAMAEKLGGWDSSYRVVPDLDFWLRGGLLGEYVHVPEVLATLRRHSGSITIEGQGSEATAERFRCLAEFFGHADLPPEIRSLERDAYRNLYFISAIAALPEFNRPEDRFIVHDRLAWSQDSGAQERPIESELLAERERADYFKGEVEIRDRVIEERDQSLRELRARLQGMG